MTVAVGFNPRNSGAIRGRVAERRLNKTQPGLIQSSLRDSAPFGLRRRGFKATATIERSLRDHSKTEMRTLLTVAQIFA